MNQKFLGLSRYNLAYIMLNEVGKRLYRLQQKAGFLGVLVFLTHSYSLTVNAKLVSESNRKTYKGKGKG